MRRIAWMAVFLSFPVLAAPSAPRSVTVARVTSGPYYFDQECWSRFTEQLSILGGDEFSFVYPEGLQATSVRSPAEIRRDCARLLADPGVDLLVASGLEAAGYFLAQTGLPTPTVLFGDLDFELLDDLAGEEFPTVPNLTYQVQRGKIDAELDLLSRMVRRGQVAVLIDPEIFQSIPGLEARAREAEKKHGIELEFVFFADTPDATVSALPADTGFIYLTPSRRYATRAGLGELIEAINRAGIPTLALEGLPAVEAGALAGLYASSAEKLARNNALKVYSILRGEVPEDQEVAYHDKEQFSLNLETARRVGYYPDFTLLFAARVIGDETPPGQAISLPEAVEAALAANLSHQLSLRELEEEEQSYRAVVANLFPQVEASAEYRRIDTDRAKASGGLLNRWETAGTVSASQLIFDYPTWKAVAIAALSVDLSRTAVEESRLDTAEGAIQAYLDVLQARELERVQKENLESTRNHLDTARVRLKQEVGSREDVWRWEAQYKSVLSSLLETSFARRKAELAFNQVLNRPQETPVHLARYERLVPWKGTILGDPRLDRYFRNWQEADLLRFFLVEEGMRRSPEVLSARLQLKMAEEDLVRSETRIWTPTLSARAGYTRNFDEEVWDPISQSWGRAGEYPDDEEWFVGASVSLPIWMGGSNWADLGRQRAACRKAGQALALQEETTGLEIRGAFFDLASALSTWDLEREREGLSRQTLEVVEDKYRKGILPIIDLLDAQSEYVSSQSSAVSSFYSAVSSLVRLERRVGLIAVAAEPSETAGLVGALIEYLEMNQE